MGCCSSRDAHIHGRRLVMQRKIGEGGFADVFLCVDRQTGEQFAMKRMLTQDEETLQEARAEIDIASKVKHPNVLPLVDFDVVPSERVPGAKDVMLLQPFCKRGNLQDLLDLHKKMLQWLTAKEILHMFRGACLGVEEMHKQGFAHRDIKPANLLVSDKGDLLVTDFGSSSLCKQTISSRMQAIKLQEWAMQKCSCCFRAPELFDVPSQCTIDERTDVWALGCTLFAMMYGASPFEGSHTSTLSRVTFPPKPSFPSELQDIVSWCLTIDHTKRPFLSDVIARLDTLKL